MAGALAELVNQVLVRDYNTIDRDDVSILLLEGADRILPDLPRDLSEKAVRTLQRKGVTVQLTAFIEMFTGMEISLSSQTDPIRSHTLIWTAGIHSADLAGSLQGSALEAPGQCGRVPVLPTLQLPESPEVFLIGDAAYLDSPDGPVPMVAPAAVQTAETAARNILRMTRGVDPQPFRYKNPGALATIGRNAAVARVMGVKLSGFLAWAVWLIVHLMRLVGFRNRLIVLINWTWDYLFFERASRLIFKHYLQQLE
jgi:NADH dehydrogenase